MFTTSFKDEMTPVRLRREGGSLNTDLKKFFKKRTIKFTEPNRFTSVYMIPIVVDGITQIYTSVRIRVCVHIEHYYFITYCI